MDYLTLASDFPAATREDWLKAVEKALGGASFDTLRTPLYEGFATEPLYVPQQAGAEPPFPLAARRAPEWRIIQLADQDDLAKAKAQVADDIENECGGYWLQFGGNLPYGGGVLGARSASEIADVFQPLREGQAHFYISGGADALGGAALLAAAAGQLGWTPDQVRGSAGLDPLTVIAATGELPADRREIFADSVDAAIFLAERGFGLKPFLISGRAWHQAGGSAVEELAFALAAGVASWRALADAGMSTSNAAGCIDFVLTADSGLFLSIAKFRAARLLWSRALEAAGLSESNSEFLAEMSYRMLAERDPYVNLLRATAATFGAGIGGADGVLGIPFDAVSSASSPSSRRLARNTSLILQHESHLNAVRDAAAGSAYIESLTEHLCERAWRLFRQVEADGGLMEWLAGGKASRLLSAVRSQRDANIARRKDRITGVSAFPDISEQFGAQEAPGAGFEPDSFIADGSGLALPQAGKGERFAALVSAAREGASIEDLERACRTVYEPIAPVAVLGRRAPEPFEELRRGSDLALAHVGSRPPVFVALLGDPSDYRARANWLRSFFAVGGIEAIVPDHGFTDAEALVEAFRDSPAPVACLCSSNKAYAAYAGASSALKQADAIFVYLAGPADALAALTPEDKRAVDRLLYEGCDAAGLLSELHQILRVQDMGHLEFDDDGLSDEG